MNIAVITILMMGSMMALLITGRQVVFVVGFIGVVFACLLWGVGGIDMSYYPFFDVMYTYMWITVPLFLFMGVILERSGVADALFDAIYKVMGGVSGGLGMGVMLICVLIAAMSGISLTATAAMGLIALPALIKRHYDKRMMTGAIQAGGALGFLIPPSIIFIVYGMIARVSIGKLWVAGVMPGILLSTMFLIYMGVRCHFHPELGPPIPVEERVNWKEKLRSLTGAILPVGLVFAVLGLIIMGVTSITESAGIGAVGSLVCAAIHRKLNWQLIRYGVEKGLVITCIAMWIVGTGFIFSKVYDGLGASAFVGQVMAGLPSPLFVLFAIMGIFFLLGCFLDDTALLLITAPIFLPLVHSFGWDPVWFGVLYVVNMQMAYLTPPFGYNLFMMKAVAPPGITLRDIYISVIPFVIIQGICLGLIIMFPQIALWLPSIVFPEG